MNDREYLLLQILEDLYRIYGYDLREYATSTVWRRIHRRMCLARLSSLPELRRKILQDPDFADQMIKDFSINVTEMFREPSFFAALRHQMLPLLADRPFIKIWHAGCATGEEAYSMAIILSEMGLYDRTCIYATDYNAAVLKQCKMGVFSLENMRHYISNYQKTGGVADFTDYYTARYGSAVIRRWLKKNIVFTHHDLTRDDVFSEMQVIVCRNVLIYFNADLQQKVFDIFYRSLEPCGYLCLGSRETIRFSGYADQFVPVNEYQRIYRKKPVDQGRA